MILVKRGKYRFDVELQGRCAFPKYLIPKIHAACREGLQSLPTPAIRSTLGAACGGGIGISLVGEREMTRLNSQYRKKNRATDVLAFSFLEKVSAPGSLWIGDIVICWPVARIQTTTFGTTIPGEIQRLTVHGMLHLFGYDHETGKADAKRMFGLQARILRQLA